MIKYIVVFLTGAALMYIALLMIDGGETSKELKDLEHKNDSLYNEIVGRGAHMMRLHAEIELLQERAPEYITKYKTITKTVYENDIVIINTGDSSTFGLLPAAIDTVRLD